MNDTQVLVTGLVEVLIDQVIIAVQALVVRRFNNLGRLDGKAMIKI